ncbi:MAG: glycosyltransferase family 4 protein, partial [Gammaproteobacteria bacterium]
MPHAYFLIPGDIATPTGGYGYTREVLAAMARSGWRIALEQLAENLSQPSAKAAAVQRIAALPENALVLVDGLALAELADFLESQRERLRLVAVMHHPAALETGLTESRAAVIQRNELRALRAMRTVVCTSRWTARKLGSLGLTRVPLRIVEPGVDSGIALRASGGLRRDAAAAYSSGLRMLCVATVTPRKGHGALVRALAQVSDQRWSLNCIGSLARAPEHARHIEELIRAHDLQYRITLTGEVGRNALIDAYAEADLFVLASQLEGYGMVLAEARAAGLPIVATRGGAVGETLAEAAAVVVEPDSPQALAAALRGIMTNRSDWLRLAAVARQGSRAPRQWDTVAAELAA